MKTAQEIANKVQDPANSWETRRLAKTEPGVAQRVILDALGITANNHSHANAIFEALGIGVSAVRQGRSSVPSVSRIDKSGGGFNIHGEGEAWDNYAAVDVDLSAIEEWMRK